MTETHRQPKGIPAGGQFAPTEHNTSDLTLATDTEHATVFAEMGAAARAGLPHTSAVHIAGLLKKSPPPVYEENVATLAAANGCTAEDIRGIDAVFNHGHRPLQVTAGNEFTDGLAAAGLTGRLTPYEGSNPDIPGDAWTYTSASGRELVISRTEDGDVTVWHEDSDEDFSFHLETPSDYATPESCVESVRTALWDVVVTDANFEIPGGFRSGDFYELREISLGEDSDGNPFGEVTASTEDGNWTVIRHELTTGTTTVDRDNTRLDGLAADYEMAAAFEGMYSEPDDGDFNAQARKVFGALLAESAKDPDAPRWAATATTKDEKR